MKINYQIMNESQIVENENKRINWKGEIDGDYLPNYDELIKNATCEEEAAKWQKLKDENFTFSFQVVYATKQKCGHWEVFQSPYSEYYTIERILKEAEEHAKESECTRCICGW